MSRYYSFPQHHTEIIIEALSFTRRKADSYYKELLQRLGEPHRIALDKQLNELSTQIIEVQDFLQSHPARALI